MAKKTPFTAGEKRILEGARRRVKAAEKLASGGRFSLGGEYFVSADVTKITPQTPFLTVSRVKDYLSGVSHGTASVMRKAGLLPYKSAATEAQAQKSRATKSTAVSKAARSKKARRQARRAAAASKAGIARGSRQCAKVIKFIKEKFAQHERYLKAGREKLGEEEYRRVVHLMYEYFGDDERMERMQESYTLTAMAAK